MPPRPQKPANAKPPRNRSVKGQAKTAKSRADQQRTQPTSIQSTVNVPPDAEGNEQKDTIPSNVLATDSSPEAPKATLSPIAKVSNDFSRGINALRSFAENIGPIADEHDKKLLENFMEGLLSEFGIELDKAKSLPLGPDDRSPDAACAEANHLRQDSPSQSSQLKSLIEEKVSRALKQPSVVWRVSKRCEAIMKVPPQAGGLLRKGALLTLVSYLDVIVSGLVRIYYKRYREALPAKTRKLSLADLREIGSIEAAEDFILNRRVDAILRKSVQAQLEFFAKTLKIDTSPLGPFRSRLIETVQRRHLLVHNGGVANRQYLDRVDGALIAEYGVEDGKELPLPEEYLRRAIDRVHLSGLILIQQCWRKWFKEDLEKADTALNAHLYDAVVDGRFVLAQNIGEYASALTYHENFDHMNMLLNLAQAYKWAGDETKMQQTLARRDWSGSGLAFRLAIHALRNEIQAFYAVLPRAAAAEEISREALVEWPIFQALRKDQRFWTTLDALFPPTDVQTSLPDKSSDG